MHCSGTDGETKCVNQLTRVHLESGRYGMCVCVCVCVCVFVIIHVITSERLQDVMDVHFIAHL